MMKRRIFLPALFSALLATMLAGQAFGQPMEADFAAVQTVNELKTEGGTNEKPVNRELFVKRVLVNLNGQGVSVVAMQIPAGKRLVIRHVTAIVRGSESQRFEVDYATYIDNGGVADRTIHRLVLEKQSSFKDSAIYTASEQAAVSADERIGGEHFSIGVSARLVGAATSAAQAQFTFSGYLEDLPAK